MNAPFRFGEFELDLGRRQLSKQGEPVALQPKVFAVLVMLVTHAGQALSKDDFLQQVWSGRFVTENVLSRCIRALRRVLGDNASQPAFIRTVRGHGYQFVAEVERVVADRDHAAGNIWIVAVLPFRPLLAESTHAALEIGLAESLISDLGQMPGLSIRPLATVLDAAGALPISDPVALAHRLRADVVVEGSLQVAENHVRLNVRAIRLEDETALMSERIDVPLADLFEVQDRLCIKIMESLALRLKGRAGAPAVKRSTRSVPAYRAYVDGRLHLAKHEANSSIMALALFEDALKLDPTYAEAMVGAAEAHDLLGTLGSDNERHFEAMRGYAQQALDIAPQMTAAHACLAKVAWQYDWDWARAEQLFKKATAQDSADAEILVSYSDFLAFRGRYGEALDAAERAGEINPFSPWVQAMIAQALYMNGQHHEAIEQCRRAIELAPTLGFNQLFLALAMLQLGQTKEAIRQMEMAFQHSGRQDILGPLGFALSRDGQRDKARELLARLQQEKAAGAPIPPVAFATILMGLGETDAALREFEKSAQQRSWHILLLFADPLFRELRARPEGLALLQQCGVC